MWMKMGVITMMKKKILKLMNSKLFQIKINSLHRQQGKLLRTVKLQVNKGFIIRIVQLLLHKIDLHYLVSKNYSHSVY